MDPAKIILIEDQLIPAYDMRRQLNDLGYNVVGVFTHAEEGLAYLEQSNGTEHFPEVIITDIYLGGTMTGLEASRIINAQYDCAVIITTGLFNFKLIEEALNNRPAFFLLKPFDIFYTHLCIQMAFYQRKLEKENKFLREELDRLKHQV
jgi:two-component system, response regulator PdtaR